MTILKRTLPVLLALMTAALPLAAQDKHCHQASAPKAVAGGTAQQVSGLDIPDLRIYDQDGKSRRFYSELVEGKVVVMNFMFTTCTTICPPMGANFGKLQQRLGARLGHDVFLLSVSVDPAVDTPQRMKAWGAQFGRRPGWTLVTGPKSRIDEILKALKVFTPDKNDHASTVLLGNDPAGRWTRANGLAAPEQLIAIIDELAAETAQVEAGQ
ncbi:MAG TPA: SCO family protein [Acidobacteriota bacterium]|nr:SCO family protein [Acidobacteriota bacterium]